MILPSYPRRPQYFAQRFIRLMVNTSAAQTIGADAFALLTVIVTTEDYLRYRKPVAFYNEQLMTALGIGSKERFNAARSRAIANGWLSYRKGRKRVAGLYFVCIPVELENIPDGSSDGSRESFRSEFVPQVDGNHTFGSVSEPKADQKPNGNPASYIPSPIPNPKETRSRLSRFDALQVELPSELATDAFKAAWFEWCEHRRELRKPLTETSTKQQLRDFAQWGPARAVAAIHYTIGKGWQGIREPDTNGKPESNKPKPEHRPFATRGTV